MRTINSIGDLLIDFLGAGICDKEISGRIRENVREENLINLYNFAQKHDLAHIVADVLFKHKLVSNQGIENLYRTNLMMALVRYQRLSAEFEKISSLFDEYKISYILLQM